MGRADASTGLHGNDAFQRHGHVHQHPVAFVDAARLERVSKLAYFGQQFLVSRFGHGAIVGFKNDCDFVLVGRTHVLVQTIG